MNFLAGLFNERADILFAQIAIVFSVSCGCPFHPIEESFSLSLDSHGISM
ncbi:MAG: hypothetical protein H6649_12810 [Caldilineae bacterium]|nr:hypothetical protein [Caldilineae bacterium]